MRDRRRGVRALLRPAAGAARDRRGGARARAPSPAGPAGATAASCSPASPPSTTTRASASASSARRRCTRGRSRPSATSYELATELGAGDAVRQRGHAARGGVGGGGASTCAATRQALREDGFPGEVVEREELPAALRRGRPRGVPDRARRRAPPGALVPPAGRRRRGRRRADPRRRDGGGCKRLLTAGNLALVTPLVT